MITTNCNKILDIVGVSEPVILTYFQSLNRGDFETTANLFALEGELYPPFAETVKSKEAIAAYLQTEAQGLQLYPRQGKTEILEQNYLGVEVTGQVQTPVFRVHVSWQFLLNPDREILGVKVNLLASPQELLKLRSLREN